VAPELLKRYESISFADAQAPVLQLIPPGRRMFEVSAEETIALVRRSNLFCTSNREAEASLRQAGVSWTRWAYQKNSDHTS
jgi:hypothetical protein